MWRMQKWLKFRLFCWLPERRTGGQLELCSTRLSEMLARLPWCAAFAIVPAIGNAWLSSRRRSNTQTCHLGWSAVGWGYLSHLSPASCLDIVRSGSTTRMGDRGSHAAPFASSAHRLEPDCRRALND